MRHIQVRKVTSFSAMSDARRDRGLKSAGILTHSRGRPRCAPARTQSRMHPPIVMTFAATDPTGGAGLQADVLTLASLGCHPVSVATAITVQDTHGVRGMHALDTRWVLEQARVLL